MTAQVISISRYGLIEVDGVERLAIFKAGRWEIDKTCESINDLADRGLIGESTLRLWVTIRKRPSSKAQNS
ncbi:MAG: hypothetical protein HWE12_13790 [Oceanospirillaceae bacterium]|nr:hypothetical protein [Oceanospirillaceae bacterium]